MKNQIDKILLSVLWVLATTLMACFWFSMRYGFNLFSGTHWRYLASLQAGQSAIRTGFYISLILFTIIGLGGLYILIRPKFRRFLWTPRNEAVATLSDTPITPTVSETKTTKAPLNRPMRPNVAHHASLDSVPQPPAAATTIATPTRDAPAPRDYPEIRDIFTNAGYTVKNTSLKIDGTPIALLAIGNNEQLWIGGVEIETDKMRHIMDRLSSVFSDTLDDIFININGFIVAPTDTAQDNTNVLTFNDVTELGQYIVAHPNELGDDDSENFTAYSEYIDTVIQYIGKP